MILRNNFSFSDECPMKAKKKIAFWTYMEKKHPVEIYLLIVLDFIMVKSKHCCSSYIYNPSKNVFNHVLALLVPKLEQLAFHLVFIWCFKTV